MHGHQIRRDARVDRAELWSGVRPGSLHGALLRIRAEPACCLQHETDP